MSAREVRQNVATWAMSVDVEDYFHTEAMATTVTRTDWERLPTRVERNTDRILEIFSSHGVRATFFFLGWVAERYPALVRRVAKAGHEIGCHSQIHRLVYRLDPSEFREDTKLAKRLIEEASGAEVWGYRAPSFSIVHGNEWAYEILAELGFRYDSSTCPVKHDIYGNPNAPVGPHAVARGRLLELPVATFRMGSMNTPVGGGGYFRILPYAYTKWGLKRASRGGKRPVFYIHPWEIDQGQPRLSAGAKSRFRQYFGLRSTEKKLHKLLRDFAFHPIAEVFSAEMRLKGCDVIHVS